MGNAFSNVSILVFLHAKNPTSFIFRDSQALRSNRPVKYQVLNNNIRETPDIYADPQLHIRPSNFGKGRLDPETVENLKFYFEIFLPRFTPDC